MTRVIERWADAVKESFETELKELDVEIKIKKAEARKIGILEEKIKTQRHIKELGSKRKSKRQQLYDVQDEVDNRKETLIEEVEKRLKQSVELEDLIVSLDARRKGRS